MSTPSKQSWTGYVDVNQPDSVSGSAKIAPHSPLLEMRGVVKRFGGVAALSNVSLTVGESEILALIGENGAGKSTLMKILGGVHAPDAGEILVEGRSVHLRSTSDAGKLGIAFIHQELSVLGNLDIAGNIFLGREPTFGGPLKLISRRTMFEEARKYIEPLGLDMSPDTSAGLLSIAHQQLVEIARALSQNARLIIMDEPTSSLTPRETERLLTLTRKLRDENNVSIIYISHRLNEVEAIADRVSGLRDGQNAGELAKSEITRDAMVRLMVGRDIRVAVRDAKTDQNAPVRLEARGLQTPRYPSEKVSFSVRAGEVLGFAGLVGAGRTEIAQALFGIAPATGGEIYMDGSPVQVKTPADAISHGVYLIPEDRRHSGLALSLPIRENISLPNLGAFATLGIIRGQEERKMAEDMVTRLNVRSALQRGEGGANAGQVADAPAQSLSGGNQQKVVLAKWLAMEPKTLLFDEPTRGVDVGAKAEIYDLIRGLAANGVAVLLISSDMEEVLGVSDRIAVMHEGKITGILGRSDFSEENVMRLAVGDALSGKVAG